MVMACARAFVFMFIPLPVPAPVFVCISSRTQTQTPPPPDDGGAAEVVSAVIPIAGEPELYLVALGKNLSVVRWSTSDPDQHTATPKIIQTTTDDHFNDAKCDPRGRLWAGR